MGENLSEAPKADGRGENLIEVPLLSPKKKRKKKKRKKKKRGSNRKQTQALEINGGCRYSMQKRRPLNSRIRVPTMLPGDLTSTSSENTHLLQGMGTISSQLSLLHEAADFLQEVLYFYRKIPVEVLDGQN